MNPKKTYQPDWRRQSWGAGLGALAGLLLAQLVPALAARFSALSLALWFAALGAVLASLDGFARAGAALTHRENRWLNLLVGLGIPLLILALIAVWLR
jgi:hypothetical protein